MKNLIKIVFITTLLIVIIAIPFDIFGQPEAPILPQNPEQLPIDGGLGILAALSGTYAIKKLPDKRRK